jgi:exopolyphosphatase/guanosine-5'-triphosphate,3'-diphosphate pyrophosphatase
VVDSFSRIVRLGEGLVSTGELSPAAMDRAHEALGVIAGKLARRPVHKARFVATQACRAARNGPAFLAEVEARTGIRFETISPREEAHLAVAGCANLVAPEAEAALVVDIGGGSTELSFAARDRRSGQVRVQAWTSLPIGVVTLADRFPEPVQADGSGACPRWYGAMLDEALRLVRGFHREGPLARLFREGRAHVIGTSGAVTSLAGVHLGLDRYNRALVDGLWIGTGQTLAAVAHLRARSPAGRAAEPCIGPERADLVLAGAAILEAVLQTWPGERLRVADRGLREGLILSMLEGRRQAAPTRKTSPRKAPRRRRRPNTPVAAVPAGPPAVP